MTGTYSGYYTSITPDVTSFTVTATGTIYGTDAPASVYDKSAGATLTNLGYIVDAYYAGVQFKNGGEVINGSADNTSAEIYGYSAGVDLESGTPGTVINYGAIESSTAASSYAGVSLQGGGDITNAAGAAILGGYGVSASTNSDASTPATITNAGLIKGDNNGVFIGSYGLDSVITNSGIIESSHNEAVMSYADGVTINNTGTIEAKGKTLGNYYGYYYPGAVSLKYGGDITNGSADDSTALIKGYYYGITVKGTTATTITNFGTIECTGKGVFEEGAVHFYVAYHGDPVNPTTADRIIDEVGSKFIGYVSGGGGASVLEFASGSSAGTLSHLGSQFYYFGTIQIDAGAQWDVKGKNTIAPEGVIFPTATLVDDGTLTIEKKAVLSIGPGGGHIGSGALAGSGTIDVNGGTLELGVAIGSTDVGFTGKGVIALTLNGDYTGVAIDNFGSGDKIKLDSQTFAKGDTAVYSAGTIEVKNNSGVVLDSFAATEAAGVTGLKVVKAGGYIEIKTLPHGHGAAAFSIRDFDHSHAKADPRALLASSPLSDSGAAEDHHAGRLDLDLLLGNRDHS